MQKPEDGDWAKLVAADVENNVGMPMELISAAIYAERHQMSREQYIIDVLRQERVRRQEEDRVTGDRMMLDGIIDDAQAAGMTVVDYIISGKMFSGKFGTHGPVTTWEVSPDFLAKLLTRYQERSMLQSASAAKPHQKFCYQDTVVPRDEFGQEVTGTIQRSGYSEHNGWYYNVQWDNGRFEEDVNEADLVLKRQASA